MRFAHHLPLAAFLLLLHSSTSIAQVSVLARVTGSVVDESGKPIRAATVTMENADSGRTVTTTTDERGRFVVLGLRPSMWRFVVAAPGFQSVAGGGVLKVGLDANPPIDVVLSRSGSTLGSLAGIPAKDIQADLATGDTLFAQQRWDEAIEVYKSILSKAPVLTNINLQIGASYRRKGEFPAAITAYEALLETEPGNEKAIVGIAQVHAESGDRKTAHELLLKTAERTKPGREVFFNLGELSVADGRLDEAVRWYQKASEVDGSWGKPLYKLGLMAAQKGELATARDLLARTVAVDPLSAEAALAKAAAEQLSR